MAGIYLHIPFCEQFCIYCDFYSVKQRGKLPLFVQALKSEIINRSQDFKKRGYTVETIYFGGGTPSLLSSDQLSDILQIIKEHYPVKGGDEVEVTLEANPDDIDKEFCRDLIKSGFNRISIGVQSFVESHLKWMNRRHTALQATESYYIAREAGFSNISIDLIFGFELLSNREWLFNINKAIELKPEHISSYQLSIEKGTKLNSLYNSGIYSPTDQNDSYRQYSQLQHLLGNNGYRQYEVSSFCKTGKESRHNSSYWDFTPYFGFGPSAHSFTGDRRFWNRKGIAAYIKSIESGEVFYCSEQIGEKERFNEFVMLSLRTVKGINKTELEASFSKVFQNHLLLQSQIFVDKGVLIDEGNALRIPPNHLFVSDGIIRELFF